MADVFISYSKADRLVAQTLADELKELGYDVWWDFELYAGDDFHDMIRAEIAKAKAVVVIWSETAVASKWVRGEAQEADDERKLISTHAPQFDPRKVPINFRSLHCEPVTNRARVIGAIDRRGAKRGEAKANAPLPSEELEALRDRAFNLLNGTSGFAEDEREAVRLYKLAADQGNAGAQSNLGFCYQNGTGVSKDEREAVRLYKLAADQGHAHAQINLGVCYENGTGGLPKDPREAVRLYKLAADQGDAGGQCNLAICYDSGIGVAKNQREAVRLYKLAADQGDADAQCNLAICYEDGIGGLAQDQQEAVRLYKLAAAQGDADAKEALKRLGQ